jgi:hypothetical protein
MTSPERVLSAFAVAILAGGACSAAAQQAPLSLSRLLAGCNVVWDSPSPDARGSMPIGNGDIGLNVWVEPSGDLVFFIGKTDAWDENMRLLKLGRVRVKFTPPLTTGGGFRQELKLREGAIEIRDRRTKVTVWVDANHPVVHVDARSESGQELRASAAFEVWRKEKRPLGGPVGGGGNEYFSTGYTSLPAVSYPDTVLRATPNRIGWYHRNVDSPWLPSLKLQKLEAVARSEKDPILNRTMGAILRGANFVATSDTELRTAKPARDIALRVHVLTRITDTPQQWVQALEGQAAEVEKIPRARLEREHRRWWSEFWNRSWVFVQGKSRFALPANAHLWRVGVASDGGSQFGGTISGPRVLGKALSAAEIAKLAEERPSVESALVVEPLTSGCTVSAWIKPAPGETGRILDKCTAGKPDGFTFDTYPGLSLRWIVGKHTMIQPNCLKPGAWQHVAATVDAGLGVRRIYVDGKLAKEERGDSSAEALTRGYALQRWMNACAGRGAFPIKFNGSIFVVDNKFDADYRAWGGGYWFQNTRLPYWSMLTAGDFDLMRPLFQMYMKALPARKLATKVYYGHGGAFFPETMSFWGNYLDQGDLGYGTDRAGKPDGLTDNPYIRRYWQGGLEMAAMMLEYYDMTLDAKFRDATLIPFAKEIVTFFDQHWGRGPDGKIRMEPSQSLETWWQCLNPTPEIAGMRYVIPRLQKLASDPALKSAWQKALDDLPPVPLRKDVKTSATYVVPAQEFANKNNSENSELYAVFPYRLYTLSAGPEALKIARDTWARRIHRENGGWQQNSIQAALLGLADEARDYVEDSATRHAPDFRFPAMWGPNYDWTPDQDHGSVMMSALQRMVVQYEGDRILVLPAWPKDLDVSFKLHAPRNTTVEGVYRAGKLEWLKVTPETRRRDVLLSLRP